MPRQDGTLLTLTLDLLVEFLDHFFQLANASLECIEPLDIALDRWRSLRGDPDFGRGSSRDRQMGINALGILG